MNMRTALWWAAAAAAAIVPSLAHAAWRVKAEDGQLWTLNELRFSGNPVLACKQGDAGLSIPVANLRAVVFSGAPENHNVKAPRTRERAVRLDLANGNRVEARVLVVTYEGTGVYLTGVDAATESHFEIPLASVSEVTFAP